MARDGFASCGSTRLPERHEVSELTVKAMIEGDFSRAYTHADNATCISTDTVKNVVNGWPEVTLAGYCRRC